MIRMLPERGDDFPGWPVSIYDLDVENRAGADRD
jgi:hypothetical protein